MQPSTTTEFPFHGPAAAKSPASSPSSPPPPASAGRQPQKMPSTTTTTTNNTTATPGGKCYTGTAGMPQNWDARIWTSTYHLPSLSPCSPARLCTLHVYEYLSRPTLRALPAYLPSFYPLPALPTPRSAASRPFRHVIRDPPCLGVLCWPAIHPHGPPGPPASSPGHPVCLTQDSPRSCPAALT